jgi:ketosteroid isomerase-like protein
MAFVLIAALASLAVDPTVAAASADIDRANAGWVTAVRRGDADTLSAPYAEDGVFIAPDGSAVRGRTAVRAFYAAHPTPAPRIVDSGLTSDGRVAAGPDDVYEWGRAWVLEKAADGTQSRKGGRYLTVWHHYPNHWRIVRCVAL